MKQIYTTLALMLCFIGHNSILISSDSNTYNEKGFALYYAGYLEGRKTASGEIFRQSAMTCAHKSLPFGTILRVTRVDNGMSVIVRVNDRGPFCNDCSVDLSRRAAEQIDMIEAGKKNVHIEVIGFSEENPKALRTWASLNAPTKSYASKKTAKTPKAYTSKGQTKKAGEAATAVRLFSAWQKGYVVQIGAYSIEENAHRQIISLQKRGLDNLFLQQAVSSQNKPINRVYIGPFETKQAANNYLQQQCPKFKVTGIVIWAK